MGTLCGMGSPSTHFACSEDVTPQCGGRLFFNALPSHFHPRLPTPLRTSRPPLAPLATTAAGTSLSRPAFCPRPVAPGRHAFVCGTDSPTLADDAGRLIFGELDLNTNTVYFDPATNKIKSGPHARWGRGWGEGGGSARRKFEGSVCNNTR